jgi:hypothetical protein
MAEQHGVLGEVTINNTLYADCADTSAMDWTFTGGISARDTSDENYDEIERNGSKIWKFYGHFEDRPKNLVRDPCSDDYQRASPASFEYVVEVPDTEDNNKLYLTNPEPDDGDGESSNEELGLLFDIIGGVGGTYTAIGSVLVDYAMDGSAGVTDERGKYTFDVPVDSSSDLPREENGDANVAEVSLRVENEYDAGIEGTINFLPSYTFRYPKTYQQTCSCLDTITEFKTTMPDFVADGDYTSIKP